MLVLGRGPQFFSKTTSNVFLCICFKNFQGKEEISFQVCEILEANRANRGKSDLSVSRQGVRKSPSELQRLLSLCEPQSVFMPCPW